MREGNYIWVPNEVLTFIKSVSREYNLPESMILAQTFSLYRQSLKKQKEGYSMGYFKIVKRKSGIWGLFGRGKPVGEVIELRGLGGILSLEELSEEFGILEE